MLLDDAAYLALRALLAYIGGIEKVTKFSVRMLGAEASIQLKGNDQADLDERIQKIDIAKQNLIESLSAIDDLKRQAEDNKEQILQATQHIAKLTDQKRSAEEQLETVRRLSNENSVSLRSVLGLPTAKEKRFNLLVGFLSGIIASVIAAFIWEGGKKFFGFT